jgi:hypothetical protein
LWGSHFNGKYLIVGYVREAKLYIVVVSEVIYDSGEDISAEAFSFVYLA